jgi:hypothetical protein
MQQLFPIVFDWLNFATIHRTSDFGHPARTQVFPESTKHRRKSNRHQSEGNHGSINLGSLIRVIIDAGNH